MHPILLIEIILQSSILAILCVSCYFDLKTRTVSNYYTYSIIGLATPLTVLLGYNKLLPSVLSIIILIGYFITSLGGADLKVLIPLFFIVPNPLLFLGFCCIYGIIYSIIQDKWSLSWQSTIPFFIPITLAYFNSIYFI